MTTRGLGWKTGNAFIPWRHGILASLLLRTRSYAFLLLVMTVPCVAGEWSGYLSTEIRLFPEQAAFSNQDYVENLSFAFEPEYYHEWDAGNQNLTFIPFLRWDQHDGRRTHFDIRELTWLKVGDDWELRVGIRKLFWGVTESQHLVDIINQTDLVEDIDGEQKLGQPMINLSMVNDWGTFDFFVLPGFRERTFPGRDGRPRFSSVVETSRPIYQSAAKEWHVDFAARWFHSIEDWDIGLYHFYGTTRAPLFIPEIEPDGEIVLLPRYDLIHQTGLDVQVTKGNYLWKFEGISRSGQRDQFFALTGGLEYTFVGIFDTAMDLGVLFEYLYDERGNDAVTPFQDDLFFGLRLALNDVENTSLLIGAYVDRKTGGQLFNLEASRRIGNNYKLSLIARSFVNISHDDRFLFGFHNDDYIQLELKAYF